MSEAKAKGGWTDTETVSPSQHTVLNGILQKLFIEQVALLLSIMDSQGATVGIKWSEIKIPEGRTVKGCMHRVKKNDRLTPSNGNG